MKILITGTAGFIGYHLANRLLERGDTVVGIDNINDYYDVKLKHARLANAGIDVSNTHYGKPVQSKKNPSYTFIKLDLLDKVKLEECFLNYQFDVVCNLAAQAGVRYSLTNPEVYVESNIKGFLNILECCRYAKTKHLVYASSSSVYGLNKEMPFSEHDSANHPVSLYAASKKANEMMAHTYSHLFGLPTTGLRFFTVYGPWGRPDMALFIFTKAILAGKPIPVFNQGEMCRDFTYVDDIVEGITHVIDSPATVNSNWGTTSPDPASSLSPFRLYNIGRGAPVQLLDFIKAIEIKTNRKAQLKLLPIQPGDVEKTFSNIHYLDDMLNYKPSVQISTGISNFIDWYQQFYSKTKPVKQRHKTSAVLT